MAAIAHPRHHDLRPSRPQLRVVPPARTPRAVIYRRRRVVAAVTALVIAAVLVLATIGAGTVLRGSAAPAAPAAPSAGEPAAVHVVQPGDTLWSIARALAPASDPRPIVDELAAEHGDGPLRPGERITLTD